MDINLEGIEFRLTVRNDEITGGFQAKYLSNDNRAPDWARITMSEELAEFLKGKAVDSCLLEAGNEDGGYERLLQGHGTLAEESVLVIRSDAPGLAAVRIAASFTDCTLQEAARYILTVSGVERYILTEQDYGRQSFVVDAMSCEEALTELSAVFGAEIDFFSKDGILYYGAAAGQDGYITLTDDNILSIEKNGAVWTAEIVPVPYIHVRQTINVECEEYTGMGLVTECVMEGGESIDMYICFREVKDG